MLSDYLAPFLLLLAIFIAAGFIYILTSPLKNRIQEIAALISIPLSVLAIISSFASIYYIYEELKYPDLELKVEFQELPIPNESVIRQLGGIYQLVVLNEGRRDATETFIIGRIIEKGKRDTNIEKFDHIIRLITQGTSTSPLFLKNLRPLKFYNGLISVLCMNCKEKKQWWVTIDTTNRKITVERRPLNVGMWERFEIW